MQNPIVHRELISLLRQRRTVVMQCLLAVCFVLLIAIRWPTEPRMALSGLRSQEVFRLFAYGLLAALLLILPVAPATSIVRERTRGTLAMLLNSPLGPVQIYGGKFLATVGLAMQMLLLSLPAAAACYALGGIYPMDVISTYLILILTVLLVTSMGLLVSTYSVTSDSAVRWTFGFVLSISVIATLPHYLMLGTGGLTGTAISWMRAMSPITAMMSLHGAADLGAAGMTTTENVVLRFCGLAILATAVQSLWAISRLNFSLFDSARDTGMIVDDQSLGVRSVRRAVFIVDPKRRSGYIGPLTNPVMVKEFRCRKFGRLHWLLRLIAVCGIISLALTILTTTQTVSWDVAGVGGIMVVLQVALIVLITPSLAAGLIATERETGGWVLLQSTKLSVWQIVWGKLLSVVLTLGLVLLATLPGYLVMVAIDPNQWGQVKRVAICLLMTALFVMLCSAAVGSLFRKTVTATSCAYAVVLTVCAAPLLFWLGRGAPFGHRTVEAALIVNPIAAGFSVIRVPGFTEYDLVPGNWWFLGGASIVCLLLLIWQTHRVSRPQ
ncbi:MAG: ABC transporter permease [Planctomycetaceae bacterium]|nr:ABC transporter permease [Planctomycetaceae bacterium]